MFHLVETKRQPCISAALSHSSVKGGGGVGGSCVTQPSQHAHTMLDTKQGVRWWTDHQFERPPATVIARELLFWCTPMSGNTLPRIKERGQRTGNPAHRKVRVDANTMEVLDLREIARLLTKTSTMAMATEILIEKLEKRKKRTKHAIYL